MRKALSIGLVVLTVMMAATLQATVPRHVAAADDCQVFPETGKQVCGVFLTYWREYGGLAQQGLPLTNQVEATGIGDPVLRHRQVFERAVFEQHQENVGTNYEVLLTLLGSIRHDNAAVTGQPMDATLPNNAPCVTFTETDKIVCGTFLDYWNTHGGLAQQGLPLTNTIMETSAVDGQRHVVQYFERAVFEYHMEYAGTPSEVLLSLVGREYCFAHLGDQCYGFSRPGTPAPSTPPAPTPAPTPTPAPSTSINPHFLDMPFPTGSYALVSRTEPDAARVTFRGVSLARAEEWYLINWQAEGFTQIGGSTFPGAGGRHTYKRGNDPYTYNFLAAYFQGSNETIVLMWRAKK